MYKIAICEDDINYAVVLKKLIVETNIIDSHLLQFHEFISGEQLIFDQQLDFDMVIMDMQMESIDGYETAMKLRETDESFLLVFCSGVIKPVPKYFKANAFRYLDKNDSHDVMLSEMADIMKELVARKNKPFILCKYGLGKDRFRVYPDSVLYIAIRHAGCQVYAYGKLKEKYPTEVLRSTMKLNTVAELFDEEQGFARIHNSYIVNMAYILKASSESVELIDGTKLSVARSKIRYFQQTFAKFAASKYEG